MALGSPTPLASYCLRDLLMSARPDEEFNSTIYMAEIQRAQFWFELEHRIVHEEEPTQLFTCATVRSSFIYETL